MIVACKGWVMGGSFQRALLCDVRVAAEGTRFRLPELTYGVIPDTGGVRGAARDVRARGGERPGAHRPRDAGGGGLAHGVVSRVVPPDELDATVQEMAEQVARTPAVAVKMARTVIAHLSRPQIRTSMDDEMIYQTFVNRSDDAAELRAARAEDRPPRFTGS